MRLTGTSPSRWAVLRRHLFGLILLGGSTGLPDFSPACEVYKGLAITTTIGQYGGDSARMREVLQAVRTRLDPADPRLKFSVRLNTSHVDVKDVLPLVEQWYRLSAEVGLPLTVIMDMPGPKMRVPRLQEDIALEVGRRFDLVPVDTGAGVWRNEPGKIPIPSEYFGYLKELAVGETLSFADGKIVVVKLAAGADNAIPFRVVELQGLNQLTSRKGFNIPSVEFRDVVTEKDRRLIRLSYWSGRIPAVAASFVQNKRDLEEIRGEMNHAKALVDQVLGRQKVEPSLAREAHSYLFPDRKTDDLSVVVDDLHRYFTRHRPVEPLIEAKLERPMAVDNAAAIADHATVLVSAQGDLGIEVTLPRLNEYTDRVVSTAGEKQAPVKVATRLFLGLLSENRITEPEKQRIEELIRGGTRFFQVSDETTVEFNGDRGPVPHFESILGYLGGLQRDPAPSPPERWETVRVTEGESPRDVFLRIYRQSLTSERPVGVKVDHPLLARMLDYLPNVVVEGPALPSSR